MLKVLTTAIEVLYFHKVFDPSIKNNDNNVVPISKLTDTFLYYTTGTLQSLPVVQYKKAQGLLAQDLPVLQSL